MGIVDRGRNAWCEASIDAAGVIVDAADYYAALFEAASKARRRILLSGWQFDSEVELLRGDDVGRAHGLPVTLKAFLNALCEANDALEIYVLAWDFHLVFALEREWMQRLVFHWTTHERLRFRFDSSHVDKGCHHQKFVVIDDALTFLGGLDLCDHRWDDRAHRDEAPLRMSRGEAHRPFHDIQVYLSGQEVARHLRDLFACRWELAGGDPLTLPEIPPSPAPLVPDVGFPLPASRVALSRTDPKGSPHERTTPGDACREIIRLYVDAIRAADRLVYVETQYLSSREIGDVLVERMTAKGRAPLELVLVLNMRAETLKEEIAVGLAQASVIARIRAAAEAGGHRLGVYYTVPARDDGEEPERATYIHAKVMIVDDRFLTIGSANLTNRSGSVDTELNATFEVAPSVDDETAQAIRALRLDLLAEHVGEPLEDLPDRGLVEALDARARARRGRLRLHPSPTERERRVLDVVDPQALPFDPDAIESSEDDRSIFAHGVGALFRRLFSARDDTK